MKPSSTLLSAKACSEKCRIIIHAYCIDSFISGFKCSNFCLQIAESESDKSEKCEWYFHLIWSRDQSSSTLGEMFQGLRLWWKGTSLRGWIGRCRNLLDVLGSQQATKGMVVGSWQGKIGNLSITVSLCFTVLLSLCSEALTFQKQALCMIYVGGCVLDN